MFPLRFSCRCKSPIIPPYLVEKHSGWTKLTLIRAYNTESLAKLNQILYNLNFMPILSERIKSFATIKFTAKTSLPPRLSLKTLNVSPLQPSVKWKYLMRQVPVPNSVCQNLRNSSFKKQNTNQKKFVKQVP